jgi:hypothetical protein
MNSRHAIKIPLVGHGVYLAAVCQRSFGLWARKTLKVRRPIERKKERQIPYLTKISPFPLLLFQVPLHFSPQLSLAGMFLIPLTALLRTFQQLLVLLEKSLNHLRWLAGHHL